MWFVILLLLLLLHELILRFFYLFFSYMLVLIFYIFLFQLAWFFIYFFIFYYKVFFVVIYFFILHGSLVTPKYARRGLPPFQKRKKRHLPACGNEIRGYFWKVASWLICGLDVWGGWTTSFGISSHHALREE